MSKDNKNNCKLISIAAVWIACCAIGIWAMFNHEFAAGSFAETPERWPASLDPYSRHDKPLTLVIAVHPGCPCTAASLEQLDRLLVRNSGQIEIIGLIQDDSESTEPTDDSYRQKLEGFPNAIVVNDHSGRLALQLGNLVSGSVIAYDQAGLLRFQGGLTASRGHAGSSKGMDLLESLARGETSQQLCGAPVFGCSLQSPKST